MSDQLQPDPAADQDEGAAGSAATQSGGANDAASDIRNALAGEMDDSALGKTPHEQLRRQIGEALAQETKQPNEQTAQADGRARDASGRFAPKTTDQPEEPAQPADQAQQPAQVDTTLAPASWKKELQARFSELPPELQAEVHRREGDFEKVREKFKRFADHEPALDYIDQVAPKLGMAPQQLMLQYAQIQDAMLDPSKRIQVLSGIARSYGVEHIAPEVMTAAQTAAKAMGTTSDQLVSNLLAANQALSDPKTKRQAVDYLIKQYGIDMNGAAPAQEPTWVDPDIAELRHQNQQLMSWFQNMDQQATQYAQHYEQQQVQQKVSLLDQFSSEKGPDGQLLRPHFKSVVPVMAAVIQNVKAANPSISDQDALQQAYEQAVWSNPTTRQQLLSAQMAAEESKRTTEARARAQAAARGAVSPPTASPQGPAAALPPKGDIRDQMRATLDSLT